MAEPLRVGILHPGAMGAALALAALEAGNHAAWASEGRSAATRGRAERLGLSDDATTGRLAESCDVLVAVCPPHAALQVAEDVGLARYEGGYLELNAVSPQTFHRIAGLLGSADVVDGALIGHPPAPGRRVRMHVAGEPPPAWVRRVFSADAVSVVPTGAPGGSASALKMAYALYSKGSLALAALARALAASHDLESQLLEEWKHVPRPSPTAGDLDRTAAAAWRWSGELEEIAGACAAASVPSAMPAAAAKVLEQLARAEADRPLDALRTAGAEPGEG